MRRTREQIEKEAAAYHEAGHCTVALFFGFPVRQLDLCACEWGHPISDDPDEARRIAEKQYIILNAGYIAHKQHEGKLTTYLACCLYGGAQDCTDMAKLRKEFGFNDVEELELWREARKIIRKNWEFVEQLASELLSGATISPQQENPA